MLKLHYRYLINILAYILRFTKGTLPQLLAVKLFRHYSSCFSRLGNLVYIRLNCVNAFGTKRNTLRAIKYKQCVASDFLVDKMKSITASITSITVIFAIYL